MIQEMISLERVLPEDIFGRRSAICSMTLEHVAEPCVDTFFTDISVLVLSLMYIYFQVRNYNFFLQTLFRSFLFKPGKSRSFTSSIPHLSYVRLAVIVVGIILSLLIFWGHRDFSTLKLVGYTYSGDAAIFLALVFVAIAFILGHIILIYLVTAFSTRPKFFSIILRIKILHVANYFFVTIPLLLIMVKATKEAFNIEMYTTLGLAGFVAVVYLFDIRKLFRDNGISNLYWFLYLCTLEILPFSLLFYPVLGGD
ncbi:MAG: DUF4271 domain-containing protein [Alistipes sp.]|nr:DUF4271 domain-containing protein [Candidatus Alistipes equi]